MGRSVAALLPPRAAASFSPGGPLVVAYRVEPPAASAQVQCTATDQEKRAVAGECMILQLAKLATHALAFARRSGRTRAEEDDYPPMVVVEIDRSIDMLLRRDGDHGRGRGGETPRVLRARVAAQG